MIYGLVQDYRSGKRQEKIYKDEKHCAKGSKNCKEQVVSDDSCQGWEVFKVVWQCIYDIQCGKCCLVPMKIVTIEDENGNLCESPDLYNTNNGGGIFLIF